MLAMLFFLFACEKDSTINNVEEFAPIEVAVSHTYRGTAFNVEDGRIKFSSENDLYSIVRAMANNYDDAAKYFTRLPNFTSSRAAYLKLIADENLTADDVEAHGSLLYRFERAGESYVDHTIDDLGLEYLANAEGIFEAGSYIYDLSDRDNPVKIDADSYSVIPDVKTFERSGAIPLELYRPKSSGLMKVDVRTCRKDFNDNSNRITGQLERSHVYGSFGVLWNFNVRTRFFRKRLGVWVGVQADKLNSDWDLWINLDNGFGTLTPTRFIGSHVAASGDRQNTRAMLVEETTEASVYMSGQPGFNRSRNFAEDRGGRGECNCGL